MALVPFLIAAVATSAGRQESPGSPVYRIDVTIHPEDGRLAGRARVSFVVPPGAPSPPPLLLMEADGAGCAPRVSHRGRRATLERAPEGHAPRPAWTVTLEPALEAGETACLELEFASALAGPASEIRLVRWHPELWWGHPTVADYDVAIDCPAEYGIGASALPVEPSGRYQGRGLRSFGLFLTREHELLELDRDGLRLRCFCPPGSVESAEVLLQAAAEATDFYRGRYGFLPQPTLTLLPGAPEPIGGHPFATGIVVLHGMGLARPDDYWRWIVAHEIGHQYWLEHVLALDPSGVDWLMIGLGLLLDRAYCRERGLSPAFHRGLLETYFRGVRAGLDTTVERDGPPVGFDFNNVVVHGKGYGIASALHAWLGEETFLRIEQRGLREFAGRVLDAPRFQALCEQEGRQELGWFFDAWLRSNGHAAGIVRAQACVPSGEGYESTIRVEQAGTLTLPLLVEARFADGTRQRAWTARGARTDELRFRSAAPLESARLDPEGELPLVPEETAER